MVEASAAEFLPSRKTLPALHKASVDCRGCGLWRDATQTVFGQGPRSAELMPVGEQPGDREDRQVVGLGAIAAKAIFGSSVKVTRDRGRLLETPLAPLGAVTIHPSAILRMGDRSERHDALAALVSDLAEVRAALSR